MGTLSNKSNSDCIKHKYIKRSCIPGSDSIEKYYDWPMPAYKLRYQAVIQELKKHGPISKLTEFGCGELNFISELIYEHKDYSDNLKEINLIDPSKYRLKNNVYKLGEKNKNRDTDLVINLYNGSIGTYDDVLKNTEALVAIETIEHLFPNTLDALPYTIFGKIQPNIVIFTTPNAEYNHLLGYEGFRNADHKFEWTRQQFHDWCENICTRFPYSMEIKQIGHKITPEIGGTSQLVIFTLTPNKTKNNLLNNQSFGVCSTNAYFVEGKKYSLVDTRIHEARSLHEFLHMKAFNYLSKLFEENDKAKLTGKFIVPVIDVINALNEQQLIYKDNIVNVEEEDLREAFAGDKFYWLQRKKIPRRGFQMCFEYYLL